MPQVGRVEISIMEEDQTRWLAFQNGELDLMNMEGPLAPKAYRRTASSSPTLAAKGVRLDRIVDPEIRYIYWNMHDPRVGGLAKEKIALRRALAMSYDAGEEIKVVLQRPGGRGRISDSAGRGRPCAGLEEHDRVRSGRRRTRCSTGSATSAAPDGWRTLPDGKPMVVKYASRPDTLKRQHEEIDQEVLRRHRRAHGCRRRTCSRNC